MLKLMEDGYSGGWLLWRMATLEDGFSEVVHWQINTFTVPLGKAGKDFVFEVSRLLRAYADGTALESMDLLHKSV